MYVPNRNRVQEVTIEGRVANQQIINRYHLRASTPPGAAGGSDGSSSSLLTSFRDRFRQHMLPAIYAAYRVVRYIMVEIDGVYVEYDNPDTGEGRRFSNSYDASAKEVLKAVSPADDGKAPGTTDYLPTHECLRVYKQPMNFRRGFFESSYNRYCPFMKTDLDAAAPERWTAALVTTWNTALGTWLSSSMDDGGTAGAFWAMAIWSPGYFSTKIAPSTDLWKGSELVLTMTASPFVGTQVSRRFDSTGIAEGR